MFVLIARAREIIIKSMAAYRTPGPAFTLPMVRHSAHPIPEDIRPDPVDLESKVRTEVLLFRRSLWLL
jgi:hypothetical protein